MVNKQQPEGPKTVRLSTKIAVVTLLAIWIGLIVYFVVQAMTTQAHGAETSFQVNLKYGAKGPAVVSLQEFLILDGDLTGTASTGNFYTLTLNAVKLYQSQHGLPQTGYFGPMTRAIANTPIQIAPKPTQTVAIYAPLLIADPTPIVTPTPTPYPTVDPAQSLAAITPTPIPVIVPRLSPDVSTEWWFNGLAGFDQVNYYSSDTPTVAYDSDHYDFNSFVAPLQNALIGKCVSLMGNNQAKTDLSSFKGLLTITVSGTLANLPQRPKNLIYVETYPALSTTFPNEAACLTKVDPSQALIYTN